jgi:hypothetical protein
LPGSLLLLFLIEKAGLIMTLRRSKNQLTLLRIAPENK